jgi:hypothetical protein
LDVQEDEIKSLLAGPLDGAAAVAGYLNLVAGDGERQPEHLGQVGIVVDEKNART